MHLPIESVTGFILQTLSAIVISYIALRIMVAKFEIRIDTLENKATRYDEEVRTALSTIARRDTEIKEIYRRLDLIDNIKIDSQLAGINTKLDAMEDILKELKERR